jgi:glycosyltransferase involved in cell wall biosynthesis
MTPRYAVDASCILNPHATGVGRYARGLVLGLEQVCAELEPAPQIVQVYRAGQWRRRRLLPRGQHLRRQIWHKKLVPRAPGYAAVLCPEFRMPRWPGVARVGVIHDIHPVLGLNQADPDERKRIVGDLLDYVGRAQRLIFVSHYTRREFSEHFEFPAELGHVVHHGVGPEFRLHSAAEKDSVRQRYGLQQPYFLWSGAPRPSKNLERLLRAFAIAAVGECQLAISGDHSEEQRSALLHEIVRLGIGGRVRLLGYVPDADIPPLFATAQAYLFPSLHEGFGMPILEAMASGTPVLTSTTTACPEAAGGHAELVDPLSVEDIARGIEAVSRCGAERVEAARAYAGSMTWAQTARNTLAVLEAASRMPQGEARA